MNYDDYIAERERRSPEFRARRETNATLYEFQIALVRARLNASLTQHELAQRIGKPQSTIARWENGTNIPRLDAILALSSALGVTFQVSTSGIAVEFVETGAPALAE